MDNSRNAGRRNPHRERGPVVDRWEYREGGEVILVVEVRKDGELHALTPRHRKQLDAAAKEKAAAWLEDYLPDLSHDVRYAVLFGAG